MTAVLSTRHCALAVVVAAIGFGTTGTAQTFAPAGAEPLSVGAIRLLVGGLLLALIGGVRYYRHVGRTLPRFTTGFWWVLLGAGSVMAYQATFFAGTRANGVAVGTVVALGSSPLFAGLFEWLGFGRRPTRRWAVATGLAVAGMVLLTGLSGGAAVDPSGVLASLGAGASYGGYTVATKAVLRRGWDATSAVSAMLGLGALLADFILMGTDNTWIATGRGLAVVAWLGAVTVVGAYLLLGHGLRGLSAATATTLTLAEPATASLLGVLVLGEMLTDWQFAGIAAMAAGVLIAGTERAGDQVDARRAPTPAR
ncbi:MAG: EamA family transporter [Propionicimonas sp.]